VLVPLLVLSLLAPAEAPEDVGLPEFSAVSTAGSWTELVDDYLVKRPTMSTLETCGSWIACTTIVVNTSAECRQAGDLFLTDIRLRLYGSIHYFFGPLASRKRARDPSVVNGATAVAHEYREHIVPAIEAVVPRLRELRTTRFGTREACERAVAERSSEVTAAFRAVVAETQASEVRRAS
jgi:hypothetical protein